MGTNNPNYQYLREKVRIFACVSNRIITIFEYNPVHFKVPQFHYIQFLSYESASIFKPPIFFFANSIDQCLG
jgi:hypothetical protein